MIVILKSCQENLLPDIVIDEFPFLIGRDEMPFAILEHHSEEMREALSFLSDQHAIIYDQADEVAIVDPGSMNGTKLNGVPLGTWPSMIKEGDSLSIAEMFDFIVSFKEDETIDDDDEDSFEMPPPVIQFESDDESEELKVSEQTGKIKIKKYEPSLAKKGATGEPEKKGSKPVKVLPINYFLERIKKLKPNLYLKNIKLFPIKDTQDHKKNQKQNYKEEISEKVKLESAKVKPDAKIKHDNLKQELKKDLKHPKDSADSTPISKQNKTAEIKQPIQKTIPPKPDKIKKIDAISKPEIIEAKKIKFNYPALIWNKIPKLKILIATGVFIWIIITSLIFVLTSSIPPKPMGDIFYQNKASEVQLFSDDIGFCLQNSELSGLNESEREICLTSALEKFVTQVHPLNAAIVDNTGKIVVHTDPNLIGQTYSKNTSENQITQLDKVSINEIITPENQNQILFSANSKYKNNDTGTVHITFLKPVYHTISTVNQYDILLFSWIFLNLSAIFLFVSYRLAKALFIDNRPLESKIKLLNPLQSMLKKIFTREKVKVEPEAQKSSISAQTSEDIAPVEKTGKLVQSLLSSIVAKKQKKQKSKSKKVDTEADSKVEIPPPLESIKPIPKKTRLGPYFVDDNRIAQGKIANIYLAELASKDVHQKKFIIKKIKSHLAENQEFIEAFEREIVLTELLKHPNIVQIIDYREKQKCMVMEYVNGRDLSKIITEYKEKLPINFCMYVISQVCIALQYAFFYNDDLSGEPLYMLHRNIKPSNILVSYEGEVKLSDFGVARATEIPSLIQFGELKPIPSYMSPEQISDSPIEHRSDIYSLGTIFYEMLSGTRLYKFSSESEAKRSIVEKEITPIREVRPDIPPDLNNIVMKCLKKEKSGRFQSAQELFDALKRLKDVLKLEYDEFDVSEFMKKNFPTKNHVS
ncbi:MAG: protein kinase [Desulfobacterales bacterium]|nr:protein kinase [Desulfobacterales bacterium]